MKCWMLWHGGGSYAVSSNEDAEEFSSLRAAADQFWRRADFDPYYPCVSQDAPEEGGPEAWIFFADPRELHEPYPDRLIRFGPRGGVRVEYA